MIVDQSSMVVNGDITGAKAQDGFRIHAARGGLVTNNSVLWNGDMDRESFLKSMCRNAFLSVL